jgi:hypothetical protein
MTEILSRGHFSRNVRKLLMTRQNINLQNVAGLPSAKCYSEYIE